MQLERLKDLYVDMLRNMNDSEQQLIDALPEMAENASHNDLKQAFQHHHEETKRQKERLEKVFQNLGEKPSEGKCKGMQGLIDEGKSLIKESKSMVGEDDSKAVLDAGLITAAQRVEHFEIASYGALCTYAEMLDRNDDLKLLQENLDEEKATDSKLNDLAKKVVNPSAKAA